MLLRNFNCTTFVRERLPVDMCATLVWKKTFGDCWLEASVLVFRLGENTWSRKHLRMHICISPICSAFGTPLALISNADIVRDLCSSSTMRGDAPLLSATKNNQLLKGPLLLWLAHQPRLRARSCAFRSSSYALLHDLSGNWLMEPTRYQNDSRNVLN